MHRRHRQSLAWLLVLAVATPALAQEWARFRGPNGTGVGQATRLPPSWEPGSRKWSATLPGPGHSSPVLWGSAVYVTAADTASGGFTVLAFDADRGSPGWRRHFAAPREMLHRNNSPATATPAADARRLYVTRTQDGRLFLTALAREDGAVAWELDLGPLSTEHGLGHSPIVHAGHIILAKDHDDAGRIVALEAATGRLVWETPRRPGRADYSVPCVVPAGPDSEWLVFNTQEDGITALEAATGRVVWSAPGILTMRSVSSPVVAGDLLLSSCGSGGGGNYVVALHPPAGPQAQPRIAYTIRRSAPYVPTPVALGNRVFLWSDGGIVTCLEAASGNQLWQERVGGNFFSSPVAADGKLFNLSTTGELVALAAAGHFALLGRTALGEGGHASPAVALGRLYVRTLTHLHCLGPVTAEAPGAAPAPRAAP